MTTQALIAQAYSAFNRRDVDAALSLMSENVSWPKASEGGRVVGKQEIREYWTRQWAQFDPHVDVLEVIEREAGNTRVKVHQLVKSLNGDILSDTQLWHVYTIANGLIERMDVDEGERNSEGPSAAFSQSSQDFDKPTAHRYFSAWCFNQAWDLIEKPVRTEADERLMVALNQASIFHWLNRPDCTDRNLSIGYWQASRIQALLGNAVEAKRYAEICLDYSTILEPFYLGYAYEALARAASIANDRSALTDFLGRAEQLCAQVAKDEDRRLLSDDLEQIKRGR